MTKQSTQADDSVQLPDRRTHRSAMRVPVWVSIVVILGVILLGSGAAISKVAPTMLTNGAPMSGAARVYADYFFARNLSLAIMLVLLLALRTRRLLAGVMVLIALIQLLDILNDVMRGEFLLVPGLLVLAVVFFAGASRLFGQAAWCVNAWRE